MRVLVEFPVRHFVLGSTVTLTQPCEQFRAKSAKPTAFEMSSISNEQIREKNLKDNKRILKELGLLDLVSISYTLLPETGSEYSSH